MNDIEVLSNRNILKQSYALNSAKYKLSALSMDLIMSLISEIKNEDIDFKIYNFSLVGLEKKLKKKIDKKYIIKIARELNRSEIIITKDNGSILISSWVSSFEFNPSNNKIEISFDPKLKPYLLSIKENFVLCHLNEISRLKSEYSKRIFMFLKQRENIGKYYVGLSNLMDILQVPISYLEYKTFKAKVIKPALKDIAMSTTLNVTYEEFKEGRKVSEEPNRTAKL